MPIPRAICPCCGATVKVKPGGGLRPHTRWSKEERRVEKCPGSGKAAT